MEYSIANRVVKIDVSLLKFITSFCRTDLTDNEFDNLAKLLMKLCDDNRMSSSSKLAVIRFVSIHAKRKIDFDSKSFVYASNVKGRKTSSLPKTIVNFAPQNAKLMCSQLQRH